MGNPNGKVSERVLPPMTGPELAAMRLDSIEQRIGNLERGTLDNLLATCDFRARVLFGVGWAIGVICGAAGVWAWTLAVKVAAR